jgi:uncharacterized membrane protein
LTRYELLLTLHILAAIVWIGGAIAIQILAIRADRAREPERMAAIAKDAEWVGLRVFAPAGLLVLLLGVGLVVEGPWSFGELWVVLGLAAYAVSFLSGFLFLGPESGRIAKAIDARGARDPEAQSRIRRIFLFSRIELAMLLLIVGDMVIKPRADDVGTLVGFAAVLVLAALAAFAAYRGDRATAPAH